MSSDQLAVIILAAGPGTRMRSARPKVLHTIAGRTLLGHARGVGLLGPGHDVLDVLLRLVRVGERFDLLLGQVVEQGDLDGTEAHQRLVAGQPAEDRPGQRGVRAPTPPTPPTR